MNNLSADRLAGESLLDEAKTTMKLPPLQAPFSDGEYASAISNCDMQLSIGAMRQLLLRKFSDLAVLTRATLMPEEPERCSMLLVALALARDAALEKLT